MDSSPALESGRDNDKAGEGAYSRELDQFVDLVSPRAREAAKAFWTHLYLVEMFPSLLFRMNCMARASLLLMQTAIENLKRRVDSEPIAAGVIAYLEALLPEERGHDDWLLDALEALGIPREQVRARIPPATVAAMVGAQYYWIHHHHPVALLGFIKVVENDPPTTELVERLVRNTGLPRGAFRYHFGHTSLEAKHNQDLDRVLDALPFSREHKALIGMSAARTVHLGACSLEEIVKLFEERRSRSPERPPLSAPEVVENLRQRGAADLL
jgi:Iron-containing redox enzyme